MIHITRQQPVYKQAMAVSYTVDSKKPWVHKRKRVLFLCSVYLRMIKTAHPEYFTKQRRTK